MNPNQDSGSARSRDKNVEAAATPPMKGHSSHIPRVAQRLNKVAKRTMDETQSRLVVALLRSYFKSFIVGFDPKVNNSPILNGVAKHITQTSRHVSISVVF